MVRARTCSITPHVGGATPAMWPRAYRLVREQLERFAAGRAGRQRDDGGVLDRSDAAMTSRPRCGSTVRTVGIRTSVGVAHMTGTVLMVGTRKGLWVGRSDEQPRELDVGRPALRHAGGLLLLVDTRGGGPGSSPAPRRAGSARRSPTPTTSGRPGRPARTAASASPATPAPPSSGSGSCSPASRTTCVWAGTEPGRRLPLRRPRRELPPGAGAVGPPAPHGVGRGLRRAGVPHAAAAPDATRSR